MKRQRRCEKDGDRREDARRRCGAMTPVSLFFFSSRRRHTSWPRDWSSDVCSSDLGNGRTGIFDRHAATYAVAGTHGDSANDAITKLLLHFECQTVFDKLRSEERRVGKECTYG